MSQAAFEQFRAEVLADASLRNDLVTIDDKVEFTAAVISLASKKGVELTADDVENAMRTGRKTWIERWI